MEENNKHSKVKVIDCTIRDGGHLHKWHFDPVCVKASCYASIKSGSDYFEIGYRMQDKGQGFGMFAYCKDQDLFDLLGDTVRGKILVMIDAGKSDDTLFDECLPEKTIITGVRVAAYPYELEKAFATLENLHKKGYKVFLNLMASSFLEEHQLKQLREWSNKDILETISFADSFGSFIPEDIVWQVKRLKELGYPSIGFHGHNNLQLAFANSLQAIAEDAQYIDASIYGMGRGTGNLPLEVLVSFLGKQNQKKYNAVPLLDVIERYYVDLFKKYNWGYQIKSLLGGISNIHPYYVDEIYNRKNYTLEEIWNTLNIIKERCPISFSSDNLQAALDEHFYRPTDSDSIKNLIEQISNELTVIPAADAFKVDKFDLIQKGAKRKFLILGNGASVVKYREKIKEFIEKENCITIGLNFLQNLYTPDYHLFVNKKRFQKYVSSISDKSELVLPSFFGKEMIRPYWDKPIHYVNVNTIGDATHIPIENESQYIVNLNVAISAILLAVQMGASAIYAVGIDGYVGDNDKEIAYFYDENDVPEDKHLASIRYERFASELERINNYLVSLSIPFLIITPTSHKKYYNNKLN